MDIFAPKYYKDFKCKQSKCNHNCCIGWEIDIDENSLFFYSKHSDIMSKISIEGTPHFILGKNNRCPFLNKNNLCELIINYGENALCQICNDHPRFVNEFDTRTEIGLGLTCEEAVRLILNNDLLIEKVDTDNTPVIYTREDKAFFDYREELFSKDLTEFKDLLPDITLEAIAKVFLCLERLDNNWDTLLNTLNGNKTKLADIHITDIKQANRLFNYFLFRHLHNYGLTFCLVCTYFIISIDYDIYETARIFSSEIEYSDENIEKILLEI